MSQPPTLARELLPPSAPTSLRFSIAAARAHSQKDEPLEAIVHYIAVLKSLSADGRRQFLSEFIKSLQAYLKWERSAGKVREVLLVASSLYAYEYGVWRVWAEWLYSQGELLTSLETYQKAKQAARTDAEWLHASVCCDNLQSQLVEQWHWRMINDGKRNWAFCSAIHRALESIREKREQGSNRQTPSRPIRMLEIGCGSGILSIFATKLPDINVRIAMCERDEVMQRVAEAGIALNNCPTNSIQLHKGHSSKLEPPPREGGGGKYELLVTETLDCGIFGERMVASVLDAKERLLDADALIVPQRATALFSLLESSDVAEENHYESGEGYAIISQSCYTPAPEEGPFTAEERLPPSPYTCTFMRHQLPSGHRLLSQPVEALCVDFNNSAQLRQFHADQFRSQVVLEATEDGVVNAVVQWFRLQLYDDVELSSAPEEDMCWQQTLFPLYPPVRVWKGEKLRFELMVRDHKLFISHHHQDSDQAQARQLLRAPADLDLVAMNDPEVAAFYLEAITDKLGAKAGSRRRRVGASTHLLDCTDLLIAERLQRELGYDATTSRQGAIRWEVASGRAVVRYVSHEASNVRCAPSTLPSGDCDAVLHWPLSQSGLLMDGYLTSILELRLRVPHAHLIPSSVVLKACLIRSAELLGISRLTPPIGSNGDVHCGVDLRAMDEYALHYFHEIDRRQLVHEQLSDEVDVFRLSFDRVETDLEQLTQIRRDCELECNKPASSADFPSARSECHAILYWFELGSCPPQTPPCPATTDCTTLPDTSITLPPPTLDLSKCKGARCSAYIFAESKHLAEGERLKIQVSLHHGHVVFHQVLNTVFL